MSKRRPPCAGLWNTPMVHLNGALTTCCLDPKLKNTLGNLSSHSLQSLWQGPTIHRWRLAQIRGLFEESGPACIECDWWSAGRYPRERIEAYLKENGELELLETFRRDSQDKG